MTIAGFLGGYEWIMILGVFLLPLIALIDIVRSEFTGNNKLIWVLIVIFIPFLGSIIYFLTGRSQKVRKE